MICQNKDLFWASPERRRYAKEKNGGHFCRWAFEKFVTDAVVVLAALLMMSGTSFYIIYTVLGTAESRGVWL